MTATLLGRELDEDDLDLSPEVMCALTRRRDRNAAIAAASGPGHHTGPRPAPRS